jgi:hypothetical protein
MEVPSTIASRSEQAVIVSIRDAGGQYEIEVATGLTCNLGGTYRLSNGIACRLDSAAGRAGGGLVLRVTPIREREARRR